jgi:hypothetical protein
MHIVSMEDLAWIRVLSATTKIIVMEDIMDNDEGYYRLGGMHTSIKASDMPKGITPKSIAEFIMAHGGRGKSRRPWSATRRGPMGGYD